MKKVICIISLLLLTVMAAVTAQAENQSTPRFQGGVKAGLNIFGLVGPRSVDMILARISFSDAIFKPGFTGGIEGSYNIDQRHSISLGALYDQRQVGLKIGSITPALFLMGPLTVSLPFVPPLLAPLLGPLIVTLMPYEKLVKETSLSIHSISVPLSYRFHALDYLYLGLGIDITMALKAKAEYKFLIPLSMDLKPYLRTVDLGGHIILGATYKWFCVELIGGLGFLDYDTFNDVRRSIYIKCLVGYRFPTK